MSAEDSNVVAIREDSPAYRCEAWRGTEQNLDLAPCQPNGGCLPCSQRRLALLLVQTIVALADAEIEIGEGSVPLDPHIILGLAERAASDLTSAQEILERMWKRQYEESGGDL